VKKKKKKSKQIIIFCYHAKCQPERSVPMSAWDKNVQQVSGLVAGKVMMAFSLGELFCLMAGGGCLGQDLMPPHRREGRCPAPCLAGGDLLPGGPSPVRARSDGHKTCHLPTAVPRVGLRHACAGLVFPNPPEGEVIYGAV
jgi:hypothetical protein